MPQKTKKEKIAASARKEYKLREVTTEQRQPAHTETGTAQAYALSHEDMEINKYFLVDLRKSLMLISIIFTLEFLLYYATINNYFKF
ncbi:MAG: hypothetical protein RI947_85 [Candidatus Parcubacteria bacterium]